LNHEQASHLVTEPFLGMRKKLYGVEPPIYGGLNYL